MSPSRLGRALAVSLLAGGVLLAACGATSCGGQAARLAGRWTDEALAGLLDAETLAKLRPPPAWSFGDAGERELWSLRGLAPTGVDGEAWYLTAEKRSVRLSRRADLPADTVATVVLRASVPTAGPARLFWSGRKAKFSRERSVVARSRPGAAEWRFDLTEQQHWVGVIQSLRFDLPVAAGGEIALESVEFVPVREPLAPVLGKPWSITLGSETRAALVVPPGAPAERRWTLPPRATTLRWAYGLLPGQPCALRGELTAAVEGEFAPRVLITRDFTAPQDERWQAAVADVSGLAGREVTLNLSSELAAPCPDATPALVVALPELLSVTADRESAPPNIVLISVDTLRADHLGLYGYGRPTSPRLDAWARGAVVFEEAVAPAPWTLPSHVSMLTGVTALAHGVNYRLPAPASLPFLAEILRAHGYSTAAWTGGSWLAPRYGFAQGFDVYHAWTAPDDWDGELAAHVEAAVDWLRRTAAEPFFLFFHTFETHAPYLPREPFYSRWARDAGLRSAPIRIYDRLLPPLAEEGFVLRKQLVVGRDGETGFGASPEEQIQLGVAYDSGIAYADRQLGRLLEALAERNLTERTLVVLTSDHGESLGEEGLVSHGHLHDSNLLVPWILALPGGRAAGERIPGQVGLVDLVPTVLDLLGLPVPGGLDGRSLAPLLRGAAPAAPRLAAAYAGSSNLGLALRAGSRRKYVVNDTPWTPLAGAEALYELPTTIGVERAVATPPAEELAALRGEAARLLERGAGLHVRIWNGEGIDLGGTLRGPCIHPVTVKSVTARAGALSWVRRQEVSFRVGPGEVVELRFDSPGSPCLVATGALAGGRAFSLALDPALADQKLLGLSREGWSELAPGAAPRTGLRAWRVGPADVPGEDPARVDPELLGQLQALGYVE